MRTASMEKIASATRGGLTVVPETGVRPDIVHSETLAGRFADVAFAASMNEGERMLIVPIIVELDFA